MSPIEAWFWSPYILFVVLPIFPITVKSIKNMKAINSKIWRHFFCNYVEFYHLFFYFGLFSPFPSFLLLSSDLLFSDMFYYSWNEVVGSRRFIMGLVFIINVTKVSLLYSSSSNIIFTIVFKPLYYLLFFKILLLCSFIKFAWYIEFYSKYCFLSSKSKFPKEHT